MAAVESMPALPEPGDFDSFYAYATELSGGTQFWGLVTQLAAAAGRPVCSLQEIIPPAEQSAPLVPPGLLGRRGYGFGLVSDLDFLSGEVVASDSPKLLFVRDPRFVLVAHHRASASLPFTDFLRLPLVEQVIQRYRRLAQFWRSERNTVLFRYEHARVGWESIAAEVAAALKLPLDVASVAAIATASAPVGDRLSEADRPPAVDIAEMEALMDDVLDAFGYVMRAFRKQHAHHSEVTAAQYGGEAPDPQAESGQHPEADPFGSSDDPYPMPSGIYEPDPVLHNRLRPNSWSEMTVLGRKVILDVDASGCRPVIGQPAEGEKTLAVYGCSFTYGVAIRAEETFCSLLQGMLPTWRVENHGVGGYSATRNLIQLERALRWAQPELVTFCWIAHHMGRNIASLGWVQASSANIPRAPQGETPRRPFPRAGLDAEGALSMSSVKIPRHDLVGLDFDEFAADPYYLDLVCFRLFERAHQLVTGYGGHFFVTTLQGHLSDGMRSRLATGNIPVVDASLQGKEYLCLPDDPHPNALANRIYAQRIHDYLSEVTAP